VSDYLNGWHQDLFIENQQLDGYRPVLGNSWSKSEVSCESCLYFWYKVCT